ncbi:MAG: hypothetical protein JEZ11_05420 [Desulfobacterales bacterium]|nr:hypothetical protein [Desulfobacterales bacterium]
MKPSELVLGLALSIALHLAVMLGLWQTLDAPGPGRGGKRPDAPGAVSEKNPATSARMDATGPADPAPDPRPSIARLYEGPLQWLRPAFAANDFGPRIDVRAGRILTIDPDQAPVLKKPLLRPYTPPTIQEPLPDPGQDVLTRTRPVTYTRAYLERAASELKQAIEADLRDCRLDEIPLDEVILRSRYLRLQMLLFEKGLEPDFSYNDLRERFMEKLDRIRRSLAGVPAAEYFDRLLFHYRKGKIYEEKRGHSLLNAIFYDIYNCRTGTEELAMYFSLFHPDLPLGFNRGSIVKFDGTLIGHVDPAVRIGGRWTVFKTVSRDTEAVAPYEIGELFPIEKLVLDYLPGWDAPACRLNRPLARNGEELDDRLNTPGDNLHPLIVTHDDSRIVLLRESVPQPETFPMISREERLFAEMAGRYRGFTGGKNLLHADAPYLDFLFHLQAALPADRRDLVHLYLKNRVDSAPADAKRPLRIPAALPGYQDLVRTLFSESRDPQIEILPGTVVATESYLLHKAYIEAHNRAIEALTGEKRTLPEKEPLPAEIARFLLFSHGRGTTLIRPPAFDPGPLVGDLVNDRYDLSPFMANETARRNNNTSSRRIAILKAGLAGDDRMVRSALETRVRQLRAVLNHGEMHVENVRVREAHEIPGAISYGETIRQQGRTGLSPGFVKDMVELMGEGEALAAFDRYLAWPGLRVDRAAGLEMFAYLDRYLLLDKSRKRLATIALDRISRSGDPAMKAAAAQYLVKAGAISAEQANAAFLPYLETVPADAATVASLLATGLDRSRAAAHFASQIEGLDLSANGAHERLDALGRIARVMGDPAVPGQIAAKHEAFVLTFFDSAIRSVNPGDGKTSGVLNSLSYLAGDRSGAAPGVFARFVAFGAQSPEALFMGEPVGRWIGPERFRQAVAAGLAQEKARLAAGIKDLVRLRDDPDALRSGGGWTSYAAALVGIRDSAARITFLSTLAFQDGLRNEAYRHQRALLERLFSLDEFDKGFETRYGAAPALERNRVLNHEAIQRAVEMAGFFSTALKKPGGFDLNHAPFIQLVGDYQADCGPSHRAINSRSTPENIAFTPAGAYFTSLLDPDNPPEQVAAAFGKEQDLLRALSARPLSADRATRLGETRTFFRGMAQSDACDMRRVYLFEKLLRQSALPETLPEWILALARDSHRREMAFWGRMASAGGPDAVIGDSLRMTETSFAGKWGESPFSLRNLYGTLLLVKTGHLEVDAAGAFRPRRN